MDYEIKTTYEDFTSAPRRASQSASTIARAKRLRWDSTRRAWIGSASQITAFQAELRREIAGMEDWLQRADRAGRWSINMDEQRAHVARLGRVLAACPDVTA